MVIFQGKCEEASLHFHSLSIYSSILVPTANAKEKGIGKEEKMEGT